MHWLELRSIRIQALHLSPMLCARPHFYCSLAASTHAFEELDSDREEAQILPCSVPYSILMRSDNLICNRGLSYRSDHTILAGR